jgi:hypothetical protein
MFSMMRSSVGKEKGDNGNEKGDIVDQCWK